MANVDQVVKQAIEESVNTFVRGVYAHGPANPDVSIPDEIVEWLKNDENVIASFKEQIDGDPDKWNTDRPRVCRAAFHAGSLAAFHAYANDPKVVNEDHVNAALEHISGVCEVRFGLMWIYCPRRPWPISEKDSYGSLIFVHPATGYRNVAVNVTPSGRGRVLCTDGMV